MSILFNISKIQIHSYFIFISFVIFNINFDIIKATSTTNESLDTIFLRLYTYNETTFEDETINNAGNLVDYMDTSKQTVLYIHGYTESINSSSASTIVNAYFTRCDHNVIAVDWSVLAGQNYVKVALSVTEVGKHISNGIKNMFEVGMPYETFYIVSHSMGSHVAGEIGRNMNPLISRIVGLDPAGPLFNLIIIGNPLGPGDAKSVHVIHTDAGVYGIVNKMGTADFWPNNGKRIQPGCPKTYATFSDEDFCSHHRSWVFYSESIKNETMFPAVQCLLGKSIGEAIPMGYSTPLNTRGNYYLTTSSKSPYSLGKRGNIC